MSPRPGPSRPCRRAAASVPRRAECHVAPALSRPCATVFTSQRFNEYLTASKFNREAKGKAFFRRPMQILAPLRIRLAYDGRCLEVRPNPAEDRIQENRIKGPGPAIADYCSSLTSERARSARMPQPSTTRTATTCPCPSDSCHLPHQPRVIPPPRIFSPPRPFDRLAPSVISVGLSRRLIPPACSACS